MKKDSNIRMSLRTYFTYVFFLTLLFSCLQSTLIVLILTALFYHGPFGFRTYGVISLIICILTLIIGGMSMWFGSKHLTKPLGEITDAVKKIAAGDFTVKIHRNTKYRQDYQYSNELDELAENVNTMTAELNSMEHMRKDFIHNVSHEIKTPIASLSGITELLLDKTLSDEEQEDYLQLMFNECNRLSNLCENMLKLSRFSNQQIVVSKKDVRIDEQLRNCVILLSESYSHKQHEFELEADILTLFSDYDLLMQIWMNLLDNAIKFSPIGSLISITAIQTKTTILVTIKDSGEGIASEKLNKIFEQFYQCEESHHKSGNGLGLSIVKQIVQLLDGSIHYTSIQGEGTTVSVEFKR